MAEESNAGFANFTQKSVLGMMERISAVRDAAKEYHHNAINDGCMVVKHETLRSLKIEAPTQILRNFPHPGSGRRMNTKYDIRESEEYALTGVVQASGPWHILEYGVPPHQIRTSAVTGRQFKKGAQGEVAALNWPGADHPAAYANHPGMSKRLPWLTGVQISRPLVPKAYNAAMVGAIADAWYS